MSASRKKYDIFISYRRQDGAQYARILQLELEKRGYSVFLDYEEIVDGVFSMEIQNAIKSAPTFIMVLTPKYLDRCMEDNSWVRREIMLALENGCHFVPVNPDKQFKGVPDDTPEEIRRIVKTHQHSDINFGQLLGVSIDRMVANRITRKRLSRKARKLIALAAVLLIIIAGLATAHLCRHSSIEKLKGEAAPEGLSYDWWDGASINQIKVVHGIVGSMKHVTGGTFMMGPRANPDGSYQDDVDTYLETPAHEASVSDFWIGKYEVTTGEWHGIMGGKYSKSEINHPVRNITFQECLEFCQKLTDICGIQFRLPSEVEWEYSARGGNKHQSTRFIGNDNPDEVSWYKSPRAKGQPHDTRDGRLRCNSLDLYDMGGNVYEWCDTPFRLYTDIVSGTHDPEILDEDAMVIRGGSYDSELYAITATHRALMNKNTSADTVGFRLAI